MRKLEQFFDWYGQFIARKPFFFILVPALLTIFSTYGFLSFHSQDDIWDIYAPTNGLSRVEEAAMKRFEYASGSHHHRMQILVSKKNRGNILTNEALEEVAFAHKFVADNITAWDGHHQQIAYKDLCGVYCNDSNAAVLAFFQASLNDTSHSSFKLSFPNAEALLKKVFIGYSIGDLKIENGLVTEAKMLILHYMVDTSLPNGKQLAMDFETKIRNFFASISDNSHHIKYSVLSRTRELEEQRAITITSLPFLCLTISVLTVFMLITLVRFPLYTSQHWQSIVGVLSPGMALWTTTGLLWGIGYPFSNILTVVPFLVITIGIDDAFLILAGWRQSTKGESLEVRLGQSVAISGASVTVTSVTDVACFATGLFSNMPVVQLFCLYTTVALAIDFFYQMTFFTALVGIFVRKQVDIEKELVNSEPKIEKTKDVDSNGNSSLASMLTFVPTISQEAHMRSVLEVFIDFLHTGIAKFVVIVLFIVHIAICLALVSHVNTNFDMENLYMEDSPLTDISRRMQDFVLGESFVVNFGVYPMPDFDNATIRDKFEEMVKNLETMPYFGAGKENTNLWTREYSNVRRNCSVL
uniref:SSD domain-containing protein n=1 Tax=Caenorhabditis japonica TaxID=281687 RepID=A0A8R1HRU7_CAEJA